MLQQMTFDEMDAAVKEAERTNALIDRFVNRFAEFLVGRLRQVSGYKLKRLKMELRDFNMHTQSWKA